MVDIKNFQKHGCVCLHPSCVSVKVAAPADYPMWHSHLLGVKQLAEENKNGSTFSVALFVMRLQ